MDDISWTRLQNALEGRSYIEGGYDINQLQDIAKHVNLQPITYSRTQLQNLIQRNLYRLRPLFEGGGPGIYIPPRSVTERQFSTLPRRLPSTSRTTTPSSEGYSTLPRRLLSTTRTTNTSSTNSSPFGYAAAIKPEYEAEVRRQELNALREQRQASILANKEKYQKERLRRQQEEAEEEQEWRETQSRLRQLYGSREVAPLSPRSTQRSPSAQRYQSPSAQRYQSPSAQRYQSPSAQRYQSPSAQRYQSPSAQRYQSPSAQRYQSPSAQRYQSTRDIERSPSVRDSFGYQSPRDSLRYPSYRMPSGLLGRVRSPPNKDE